MWKKNVEGDKFAQMLITIAKKYAISKANKDNLNTCFTNTLPMGK